MRGTLLAGVFAVAFAFGVVNGAEAAPITIHYETENVAGNRWLYRYYVTYSDPTFEFSADEGFAIYFDYSRYENIQDPPPSVSDWDPIVVQPDSGLSSDGFYDALALTNAPSLPIPFTTLEFDWLAHGAPGFQPFELYRLVNGTPEPFDSGVTQPLTAVSEPGTLLLFATGWAGFARAVRRYRRT